MVEPVVLNTAPLVNLNGSEAIVTKSGSASAYFLRYLQDRNGFLTEAEAAIAQLAAVEINAGGALSGGGPILDDPTISLDALSPDPSGTYDSPSQIVIDPYGRVTAVTAGTPSTGYYVTGNTGVGAATFSGGSPAVLAGLTITIPASNVARVFGVNIHVGSTSSSTNVSYFPGLGIFVDSGALVVQTQLTRLVDTFSSGFLGDLTGYVTIPGDNATHTINADGRLYGTGGSITATLFDAQMWAIQIA